MGIEYGDVQAKCVDNISNKIIAKKCANFEKERVIKVQNAFRT
jgi:hypothetical protein